MQIDEEVGVGWNQAAADSPRDRCMHELFEQQVEQVPDRVAVVFEGEQLTYDGLNGKTNQLARDPAGASHGAGGEGGAVRGAERWR